MEQPPSVSQPHSQVSGQSHGQDVAGVLPVEVLLRIFKWLDPISLVRCSVLCRQWHAASSHNYLWKKLYLKEWHRWVHGREDIEKMNGSWKMLFGDRVACDSQVMGLLERMCYISSSAEAKKRLMEFGVVIWEKLTEIETIEKSTHLAIQYHAEKILKLINSMDLKASWKQLLAQPAENQSMEDGALLIAKWEYPHFNEKDVIAQLDSIAKQAEKIMHEQFGTEQERDPIHVLKAVKATLFEDEGFYGNDKDYYNVENSYINKVLEKKCGIPISLSTVVAAVARRLGVHLHPVNFPGHFLLSCSTAEGEVYVDSFNSCALLTREDCKSMLGPVANPATIASHLSPVQLPLVWVRMLANLILRYKESSNLESLLGILEQTLLIQPDSPEYMSMRVQVFIMLERYDEAVQELERWKKEKPAGISAHQIHMHLQYLALHNKETVPKKRSEEPATIQYKVGQVLKHVAHSYVGVIIGWDSTCGASEDWKMQMGIYRLSQGANQPFYRVLVDNKDRPNNQTTYVAQENINLMETPVLIDHSELGKYFLRVGDEGYVPREDLLLQYPEL